MVRMFTRNGLNASDVISAFQKHIRRGEEVEAMQAAAELLFSSNKAAASWLVNRLVTIAHEDIGIANMQGVMFVQSTIPFIREMLKDAEKIDRAGMLIGNCILALCRGPKSRLGDHFQCAAGKPIKFGTRYEIPEYAYDKHTGEGRKLGRGLDHFRESSAKLVDREFTLEDPYADIAYELWAKMESGELKAADPTDEVAGRLF